MKSASTGQYFVANPARTSAQVRQDFVTTLPKWVFAQTVPKTIRHISMGDKNAVNSPMEPVEKQGRKRHKLTA